MSLLQLAEATQKYYFSCFVVVIVVVVGVNFVLSFHVYLWHTIMCRQARNHILWNYGFMKICFHIKTCLVATYKCSLAEILTISQLLSNACTQTGKKPNSVELWFHDNLFPYKNMPCGYIQMYSCRNINYLPIIIKCMYSDRQETKFCGILVS